MKKVLVLNNAYLPTGIITWQDAIILWWKQKAEFVSVYGEKIHSPNLELDKPCIIRLTQKVHLRKNVQIKIPLTRRNIWERDDGICQYCGQKLTLNKMTIDHVLPRSQGGQHKWKNVVCCCFKCNNKKDNKTPEQANMKLLHKPIVPRTLRTLQDNIIYRMKNIKDVPHKSWENFLFWNK